MEALRGSMKELGWLKTILVNKTTGHVLDGHARVEEAMRQGLATIPATIVELSEREEKLALAVLDPITEMAYKDFPALNSLLAEISTSDAGLQALLDQLAGAPLPSLPNAAELHWNEMPEYDNPLPWCHKIVVNFEKMEDIQGFFRVIGQEGTDKTKSIWFPYKERRDLKGLCYQAGEEGGDSDD